MEENTRTLKYIANKELKKIQLEEGLKEEEEVYLGTEFLSLLLHISEGRND